MPVFRDFPEQTGPQRTDRSASNAILPWLFSGRHMRSPVSKRALSECNAIRSWGFGPGELTFVGFVESDFGASQKPVSG
jgi:hypothetical protein